VVNCAAWTAVDDANILGGFAVEVAEGGRQGFDGFGVDRLAVVELNSKCPAPNLSLHAVAAVEGEVEGGAVVHGAVGPYAPAVTFDDPRRLRRGTPVRKRRGPCPAR
jgi:hypothetical protein